MSLRLRIHLGFLAVVSLLAIVGLVSARINTRVQGQLQRLRPGSGLDLANDDLLGTGVEISGTWEKHGGFLAAQIERQPQARRPKLRGTIEGFDPQVRTLRMYGLQIQLRNDTELLDAPPEQAAQLLRAGSRAEVSCRVDDAGHWVARKIRLHDVKEGDKIKGTVTRARLDRVGVDTLEISGIPVLLPPVAERRRPTGHLFRMQKASQMTLEIQELRIAALDLLERPNAAPGVEGPKSGSLELPEHERAIPAATRLLRARNDFEQLLQECLQTTRVDVRTDVEAREVAQWLEELVRQEPRFDTLLAGFQERARRDDAEARGFFYRELDPFLQAEVLPIVLAVRSNGEEELADNVRAVSIEARRTTRLVVLTSIFAGALALLLAFLVWRSISRPLRTLRGAAQEIGRGRFDTRVDVQSRDELGVLADAFNTMVEKLATTTVSVANLAAVHDSMAAALVLVDARGCITQVNRAAAQLLGYEPRELVGLPFETICLRGAAMSGRGDAANGGDAALGPEERVLRRKDASTVPVSFSSAVLRGAPGDVIGFVCVALDLTERKRIEERLRCSLSEKELLLREVHHRVKNNLQVISSLLDLQSRSVKEKHVLEEFEESQSRIRSMALIHEQLYGAGQFDAIDMQAYLERLVAHLVQSFGRAGSVRLRMHVQDLGLDIDRALACGLIVNELVCNALKHAFPGERAGEIRIDVEEREGRFSLRVGDDGRGLPDAFALEKVTSLGLNLVVTLVKQLDGRFSIARQDGTEFRIDFPLGTPATPAVVS